ANSVRMPMPHFGAACTTRRTASAPERWPATRGKPRAVAHLPFPSMIIPTCRELCVIKLSDIKKDPLLFPHCLNQAFHVIQIALQGPPARRRNLVLRLGHAAFE